MIETMIILLSTLILIVSFSVSKCQSYLGSDASTQSPAPKITITRLVGIEGVGHHGFELLYLILQNKTDIPPDQFYRFTNANLANTTKLEIEMTNITKKAKVNGKTTHAAVYCDDSIPYGYGPHNRNLNVDDIKDSMSYDIETTYNTLMNQKNVNYKILFLTRNFTQAAKAHELFDYNYHLHTRLMATYLRYIYNEYLRVEDPTSWRGFQYEWLFNKSACPEVVDALVSYLEMTLRKDENAESICHDFYNSHSYRHPHSYNTTPPDAFFARTWSRQAGSSPIPWLDVSPELISFAEAQQPPVPKANNITGQELNRPSCLYKVPDWEKKVSEFYALHGALPECEFFLRCGELSECEFSFK